ncbi:hypothetical protein [Vibrio jasicida]|uniref:hypothetical protein n=1 Tax=Vibrio jasicida TaxID=766224 RepID=UPI0040677CDF
MKLTDYLAIYAAVLSTLVFIWNMLQSKPKVRVDLIYGIEEDGDDLKSGVYIFVRNLSSHQVHLSNLSLMYPYRKVSVKERIIHAWKYNRFPIRIGWVSTSLSNYSIDDGCPICIEPRMSHKVLITDDKLAQLLDDAIDNSVIACAQDQLWNNTYSKVFVNPVPENEKSA